MASNPVMSISFITTPGCSTPRHNLSGSSDYSSPERKRASLKENHIRRRKEYRSSYKVKKRLLQTDLERLDSRNAEMLTCMKKLERKSRLEEIAPCLEKSLQPCERCSDCSCSAFSPLAQVDGLVKAVTAPDWISYMALKDDKNTTFANAQSKLMGFEAREATRPQLSDDDALNTYMNMDFEAFAASEQQFLSDTLNDQQPLQEKGPQVLPQPTIFQSDLNGGKGSNIRVSMGSHSRYFDIAPSTVAQNFSWIEYNTNNYCRHENKVQIPSQDPGKVTRVENNANNYCRHEDNVQRPLQEPGHGTRVRSQQEMRRPSSPRRPIPTRRSANAQRTSEESHEERMVRVRERVRQLARSHPYTRRSPSPPPPYAATPSQA